MKIPQLNLIIFVMLISCSKVDTGDENPNSHDVLLKRMEVDGLSINFFYEGNKLVKISPAEDGTLYQAYSYKGNQIVRIEFITIKEDLPIGEYHTYFYSDNKLIQSKSYRNEQLNEVNEYTYNIDGTITVTPSYYNKDGTIISSGYTKYFFDGSGNTLKAERYNQNGLDATTIYEFDTKNNPHINITGYDFYPGGRFKNNIIKETTFYSHGSTIITYQYIYNSLDYPISSIRTSNGIYTSYVYHY